MQDLDTREWLLTNGLGSFASGTVSDTRTRTYHGWLIAALTPPSQRQLLLSHLDASLVVSGEIKALSTNFWGSGTVEPTGYKLCIVLIESQCQPGLGVRITGSWYDD